MWRFKKAADNSALYILSLEGTRLQKELGELYVPLIYLLLHSLLRKSVILLSDKYIIGVVMKTNVVSLHMHKFVKSHVFFGFQKLIHVDSNCVFICLCISFECFN